MIDLNRVSCVLILALEIGPAGNQRLRPQITEVIKSPNKPTAFSDFPASWSLET